MPANLESSAVAIGLEKVSFHSNPKERQCQRMFKVLHNCTSKVMLKILQARLQKYVNQELSDVQAGFRGTRDQTARICWIIEKAREFQKSTYFSFIDYAKAFDCVYHNKLWKILKEVGIPEQLTCLRRNLYAGQEASVRTGHGTTDWFKTGKGVHRGWILSPCFLGGSDSKVSVYNAGDLGSIPGLGGSSGEGNGNPLQYYGLEKPMDRGAW